MLISGHVFIARKHEVPEYLMLLFNPEDRRNRKTRYSSATDEVSFFSTVRKVKARLDNMGLDLNSLRNAFKKLPLISDDVTDFTIPNFLSNEENLQRFLSWWERGSHTLPEDIGFLLSELNEDFRYSPIGHLFLIRLLCEYLNPETEVILDLSEILMLWDDFDPLETDIHKELLGKFADELETGNLFSQLLVFPVDNIALIEILHGLNENDLINYVLVPLLNEMGFRPVTPTRFHGPGELGKDILPFFKENEFGFREYYAVQAKAVGIHAKAGKSGNVNEVIDQAKTALSTAFFDPTDNSRKKIDHLVVVTSHGFSGDARTQIEETIKEKREIMLIDDEMLVKLLRKHEQALRQNVLRWSPKIRTVDKRKSAKSN